jgi:tetratricopeptide (TPR) repeat protein
MSTLVAGRREAIEGVIAAARSGNLAEARRLSILALGQGIEHPLLLNLRALDHEDGGRFEAALTDLRRAHVLAPNDHGILNACGLALGRLERPEEALQCFEQVVATAPDFGPGWFNRGWALERLGEKAKAAASYEKAAALNPENAQAWANLAFLAARRGDTAAAETAAEKALVLQPGHPTAVIALADAEMREPAKAERRLRALLLTDPLGPFDRALALGLLGDALDAADRPQEAFTAYSESNALFRRESAARFEGPDTAAIPETLAWLNGWADALDPQGRNAPADLEPGVAGEAGHVFLLGFPRSGTTLIATMLTNHPDVVSLEERNTLYASVLDFLVDARALSRLGGVAAPNLRRYRDDYWARVKQFGVDPAGKVFIDKNPFNTLKLPLIHKLFPHARIIFAVRDPRDVVLSCFRRRFNLNSSTYEFLDLGRTAANYHDTMRLAETLRPKQRLAEHRLVYERLIEDFPGEARATCDFIGVDWREDLVDVAARGRRGDVASASSAQIARGLFTDGAGHWRRYRAQLAPVMPLLAPWVERFGYPAD